MSEDLILNATVIAANIGAFAVVGTLFLKRHFEKKDEVKKKREESEIKKSNAYKQLRILLADLSDRGGSVTREMLKNTDNSIQKWAYGERNLDIFKEIQKEHQALHLALDTTVAKFYNNKPTYPIPKEDWEKIKQYKIALMNKLENL